MGVLKTLVEAIETRMIALGFTTTSDVFDFDAVPSSVIHKAFRIEAGLAENEYHPFNLAATTEILTVWIAYKTHRNERAVWKTALDDREAIERDLINSATIRALASDPLLAIEGDAEVRGYEEAYLISRIPLRARYVRDIS